jgi:hypothetical protein
MSHVPSLGAPLRRDVTSALTLPRLRQVRPARGRGATATRAHLPPGSRPPASGAPASSSAGSTTPATATARSPLLRPLGRPPLDAPGRPPRPRWCVGGRPRRRTHLGDVRGTAPPGGSAPPGEVAAEGVAGSSRESSDALGLIERSAETRPMRAMRLSVGTPEPKHTPTHTEGPRVAFQLRDSEQVAIEVEALDSEQNPAAATTVLSSSDEASSRSTTTATAPRSSSPRPERAASARPRSRRSRPRSRPATPSPARSRSRSWRAMR